MDTMSLVLLCFTYFFPDQHHSGRLMLPLLLAVAAGCAESKGDVSDQVTFKGPPLPSGKVTFLCEVATRLCSPPTFVKGNMRSRASR
jgi:hypothetical protein